jgi:2-C-methyl-D-erythritol 2,4-cyclodiphosphate synthase
MLHKRGWKTVNVDATIVMERPKLRPHVESIRSSVAACLGIEPGQVSVKATTSEGMGFVGREEGPAVYAVALIEQSLDV